MEKDSARVGTRALRSWVYGVALLLAVFLVVTECSMSPDRSEADDKPETEQETEPDSEPAPEVTIAAAGDSVTEGEAGSFTVTAMPPTAADLVVSVTVTETGDTLAASVPDNVTIAAGQTTATLQVTTVDDDTDESDSTVTATVGDGTGYTVGAPGSAGVTVADNDGASPTPTPTLPPASRVTPPDDTPPGDDPPGVKPTVRIASVAPNRPVTEGDSVTVLLIAIPAPTEAIRGTVFFLDSDDGIGSQPGAFNFGRNNLVDTVIHTVRADGEDGPDRTLTIRLRDPEPDEPYQVYTAERTVTIRDGSD